MSRKKEQSGDPFDAHLLRTPKIKEEEIVVWYLSLINIYGKIKNDYIWSEYPPCYKYEYL